MVIMELNKFTMNGCIKPNIWRQRREGESLGFLEAQWYRGWIVGGWMLLACVLEA